MSSSAETPRPTERVPTWVLFALALAAVTGASFVFIFGLSATLSWEQVLAAALAIAAIAGGTLFTVLEMQRLGRRRER